MYHSENSRKRSLNQLAKDINSKRLKLLYLRKWRQKGSESLIRKFQNDKAIRFNEQKIKKFILLTWNSKAIIGMRSIENHRLAAYRRALALHSRFFNFWYAAALRSLTLKSISKKVVENKYKMSKRLCFAFWLRKTQFQRNWKCEQNQAGYYYNLQNRIKYFGFWTHRLMGKKKIEQILSVHVGKKNERSKVN